MALFQKSVTKKYRKGLDPEAVKQSWQLFRAHFQNATIQQQKIRTIGEETFPQARKFIRKGLDDQLTHAQH